MNLKRKRLNLKRKNNRKSCRKKTVTDFKRINRLTDGIEALALIPSLFFTGFYFFLLLFTKRREHSILLAV